MNKYGFCPDHKNSSGPECPECEIKSLRARVAELEEELAVSEAVSDRWREKAMATETDRIRSLELQIEALKVGPHINKFA
jgi:DNA repair exonuclease SbcCD ATPase subunit